MKYRYRVLGFLFVFSVITYIDRICISVAGKSIQEDLGLSPSQWGWVLGAFALSYSLFEIPAGSMGDRFGPRKVLTRIVSCWSLFTVMTGLVTNFWQLVVVRFLFGAGEAGAYPNSAATISRWFPKVERARAHSVVWMASRIGSALTPLLVIPVLTRYGWHATFFIFGAAGLIWAAVWYWWFRDTPAEKAGVSAAELAETAAESTAGPSHHSLPWKVALRSGNFWWLLVMYHAHVWAAFFFVTWLHTFLENGRGYTKADLLQLSWIPFVCGAGANLLGGFTSDLLIRRIGLKWARRAVGIGGHSFSALMLVAVFFVDDKMWTIACLALAYAGSDFMLPVAWAVCLDIGGKHSGAVSGAMNTAGNLGGFFTTIAFGYIVDGTGDYSLPLIPIILMSALSAIAWFKIDATRPLIPVADPSAPKPSPV